MTSYFKFFVILALACAVFSTAHASEAVCASVNESSLKVSGRVAAQKKLLGDTYSKYQTVITKELSKQSAAIRASRIENDKKRQAQYTQLRKQAGTDKELLQAVNIFQKRVDQAVVTYHTSIAAANSVYGEKAKNTLNAYLTLDTKALDAYATSTKKAFEKAKTECIFKDVRSGLRTSIAASKKVLDTSEKQSLQASIDVLSKERQQSYQEARITLEGALREAREALPSALQ